MTSEFSIKNFYKGKSVLVTGCTGFVGIALLEKLLFSCPDLKNIYVLLKPKHGLSTKERLELFIKSQVFTRVREIDSNSLKKIIPVTGDLKDKKLGLCKEDEKLLCKNVSVVFHVAANINFTVPLKDMLSVNTIATRQLLDLCRKFDDVKAFIYVSTAYSNCKRNNDVVGEQVYHTSTTLDSILYAVENSSPNNSLINNLIEGRPNLYTFSKALTEQLIKNQFSDLPIAIIRPSIIIPALKEPQPGWIETPTGANNVILLAANGLLRVWHGDPNAIIDLIPVDIVVNTLIAAAWDIYEEKKYKGSNLKVFNCCTGLRNPILVKEYVTLASDFSKKYYEHETLIPPSFSVTKNSYYFSILYFILQTLPAYLAQGLCFLLRRQSRSLDIHEKATKLVQQLLFYPLRQFTFIDENMKRLHDKMNKSEESEFCIDVKIIDWPTHLENYVIGIKKQLRRKQK